jgi:hypothetical protein
MSFFHRIFHHISFSKIDPLGDGLREEIEQEQLEPEAITLEEGVDEGALSESWQEIQQDIEKDPEWFHFSDSEE